MSKVCDDKCSDFLLNSVKKQNLRKPAVSEQPNWVVNSEQKSDEKVAEKGSKMSKENSQKTLAKTQSNIQS